MNIIKIACLGLVSVMTGLTLKQAHSPLAETVSIAACILLSFFGLIKLSDIFKVLNQLSAFFSAQKEYIRIMLKIIGITYVCDFTSNVCQDAGYRAIAGQIELFGKISILSVSSPIILALLETMGGIIGID